VARTPAAIVIDQDRQARYEIKAIIRATGLTFSGEAGYGQEAISLATETRPDVIIVALNEPAERALQTIDALQGLFPETPIVVYSQSRELELARQAMLAGARDFLPLPVRPETLRDSILKAMAAEESKRLRKQGQSPAPSTVGTVITVFGAKGGIGKSTVATNLAVALASHGTSVVIVDLDNGFGDVAGMLDVKPERTLFDLVRDLDHVEKEELKRYLARHEASGLDVLASPPVLEWRKLAVDDLRRVIELLAKYYDKVVLDTLGTLNEVSETALDMATMVLWITTTEFASVRDSIEAMKALDAIAIPKERMRVVVNAISPDDSVRPQMVQEVLQKDVFWQVPYDRRVRQGTHLGQPIVVSAPQSVAARSFADLATVISGGRSENGHKPNGGLKWFTRQQPANAGGS